MEALITLIFIAIIFWKILSFFKRMLTSAKAGQQKSEKKGLLQKFQEVMEQIEKDMAAKAKTGESGGEADETSWERFLSDRETVDAETEAAHHAASTAPAPPPPPQPGRSRSADTTPRPVPEAVMSADARPHRMPATRRRRLQQAVVWSEILASPVSLRDPR